jgi:hypothetical protein
VAARGQDREIKDEIRRSELESARRQTGGNQPERGALVFDRVAPADRLARRAGDTPVAGQQAEGVDLGGPGWDRRKEKNRSEEEFLLSLLSTNSHCRPFTNTKSDCASLNLNVSGAREFPEVIVPFSVMLSRGALAGTLSFRSIVIESPDFRLVNWISVAGLSSVALPAPASV